MKVLTIDPGGSTGIAYLCGDEYGTLTVQTAEAVWGLVESDVWNHVICESFASGGVVSSHGFKTVQIIGGIRALCWLKNIPVVYPPPQKRLAFVDEATKMVQSTGKKKTQAEHEISALAHLLAWRNVLAKAT